MLAIGSFPHLGDVFFFLGESYLRLEKLNEANTYFEKVLSLGHHQYTNRVLDKRGQLLLQIEKYEDAETNYKTLSKTAKNRKEKYIAQEGLMLTHYAKGDLGEALIYAQDILSADWKPSNADRFAFLIIGKIHAQKGKKEEVMDAFINVINGNPDALGAEANYLLAKMHFDRGEYEEALESLFQLNTKFGGYDQWIGKSFLLMASIYIQLDELLQAKATLNSLIEHFPLDSVKEEAKIQLAEVEKMSEKVIKKDSLP